MNNIQMALDMARILVQIKLAEKAAKEERARHEMSVAERNYYVKRELMATRAPQTESIWGC